MSVLTIKDRDFYHKITFDKPIKFQVADSPAANDIDKNNLPPHLQDQITIIDSVNSGLGRSPETDWYKKALEPILKILAVPVKYLSTTSATSVSDFAALLPAQKASTVVLLSGDTSINEFVNALSTSQKRLVTLAVIPMGSGNAFALELGLKSAVDAIVKLFSAALTVVPFNLYEARFASGSYFYQSKAPVTSLKFFVVASWGLHAAIVSDSDSPELRKLGNKRFQQAAQENIQLVKQDYAGKISLADVSFPTEHHGYFLFALVKSLEKDFPISPKSEYLNRKAYLIDVPYIESDKGNEFLVDILTKVYLQSSHIHDPRVRYVTVPVDAALSIEISSTCSEKQKRICVDGEIVVANSVKITSVGNVIDGLTLKLIV